MTTLREFGTLACGGGRGFKEDLEFGLSWGLVQSFKPAYLSRDLAWGILGAIVVFRFFPQTVCPMWGSYGKSKGPVLDRGARPGREHFAWYSPQHRDVV